MTTKQRLSASVDSELIQAANASVRDGRSGSVSAWVNEALRRHVAHENRLRAVDEFLEWYESEHGEITENEMVAAQRWAAQRTVVVNGAPETVASTMSAVH